ncbi:SDR family NAD(P)-dependent oxidoreductase [Alphaproteobacteria bacterium]|nr:SDR family NAD(P)-dependent oxidoreductase [Alphaproteobacteria bacterium]
MVSMNIAVFGSSGAIGEALCIKFSQSNNVNKMFAFSRNGDQLNNKTIISKQVDYLNEDSLFNTAQSLQCHLDIIIVAIGALKHPEKSIRDLSSAKFIDMFTANTIPTALIAKYFLPHLYRDRITKFASISARVGSIEDNHLGGWYSYRASKSALNMILKGLSIEQGRLNPDSIIFGLHPGTVDSKLSKPFQKKDKEYFTPEFSAEKLINVIDTKTIIDNGKIFDWDNKIIPY